MLPNNTVILSREVYDELTNKAKAFTTIHQRGDPRIIYWSPGSTNEYTPYTLDIVATDVDASLLKELKNLEEVNTNLLAKLNRLQEKPPATPRKKWWHRLIKGESHDTSK